MSKDIDRSLAIFYHPIFQELVSLINPLYNQDQNKMYQKYQINQKFQLNFIQFIEFNIRLQKTLLPTFDLENAYLSALNDWSKEVQECFQVNKEEQIKQIYDENGLRQQCEFLTRNSQNQKLFLNFEIHKEFQDKFKQHDAYHQINFFFSIEVIQKFIFDLCTTWCEYLDIELFLFFFLSIYFSISEGQEIQTSVFKPLEMINPLQLDFHKDFEQMKLFYTNNKKKKLKYYRAWCEWNYLRLNQLGENIIMKLIDINGDQNHSRIIQFVDIIEASIEVINMEITSNIGTNPQTNQNSQKFNSQSSLQQQQISTKNFTDVFDKNTFLENKNQFKDYKQENFQKSPKISGKQQVNSFNQNLYTQQITQQYENQQEKPLDVYKVIYDPQDGISLQKEVKLGIKGRSYKTQNQQFYKIEQNNKQQAKNFTLAQVEDKNFKQQKDAILKNQMIQDELLHQNQQFKIGKQDLYNQNQNNFAQNYQQQNNSYRRKLVNQSFDSNSKYQSINAQANESDPISRIESEFNFDEIDPEKQQKVKQIKLEKQKFELNSNKVLLREMFQISQEKQRSGNMTLLSHFGPKDQQNLKEKNQTQSSFGTRGISTKETTRKPNKMLGSRQQERGQSQLSMRSNNLDQFNDLFYQTQQNYGLINKKVQENSTKFLNESNYQTQQINEIMEKQQQMYQQQQKELQIDEMDKSLLIQQQQNKKLQQQQKQQPQMYFKHELYENMLEKPMQLIKNKWIETTSEWNKNKPSIVDEEPSTNPIYHEAIQEYKPIWKNLLKEEELISMNDWESLFKIIKLLKQNFIHETKNQYLSFLQFDVVDPQQRIQEMNGEITKEDKEKFSLRIQKLLKRDQRRKNNRKKKQFRSKTIQLNQKTQKPIKPFQNANQKAFFQQVFLPKLQ